MAAEELIELLRKCWHPVGNPDFLRNRANEAVDALLANPEVVLRAFGIDDVVHCPDRWACCVPGHRLNDEERRNA